LIRYKSHVLTPKPSRLSGTGSLYFVKRGLNMLIMNLFPLFASAGENPNEVREGGEFMLK